MIPQRAPARFFDAVHPTPAPDGRCIYDCLESPEACKLLFLTVLESENHEPLASLGHREGKMMQPGGRGDAGRCYWRATISSVAMYKSQKYRLHMVLKDERVWSWSGHCKGHAPGRSAASLNRFTDEQKRSTPYYRRSFPKIR